MSINTPSLVRRCRLATGVRRGATAVAACFLAAPLLAAAPSPSTNLPTNLTNLVGIDAKNIVYGTNSLDIVTSAARSAADVTNFNIAAGYRVGIAQPSASANVLFRVLSNDPSVIYGSLSSNGGVYLVNPGGLFVGSGGQIDVARFVATTLGISNADFLAGRNLFLNDGTAKDVINQGEITTPEGGSVYLIGSNVSNEGIITTPKGESILAAGATVSLIDSALPGVRVDITGAAGNSTNLGTITAEAGRIGIAGVIARNSGTLNASSVVSEGGRVFLKASRDAFVDGSGRITATGTKGGQIEVLGDRVAVMDNASIDASGENGGGRIMIGGDYQGKNPDVQNSRIAYFGRDAALKADATKLGDGGTVIVWADDTTRAYGNISARGGASGGNGGFVETSGKRYLDVAGIKVSTASPYGATGTWLLDPTDITIVHSAIPGGATFTATIFDNGGGTTATLTDYDINSNLASNSITVTTSSGNSASGDIKFDASAGAGGAITISNGSGATRTLTLTADRDIRFEGGSTTFQTTAASSPLAVNFNPAANRKVEVDASATLAFNGFDSSSAATGAISVGGAVTKTWENYGTFNLAGESYIDLEAAGYYALFNNMSGGVLNIASTANWSFLSESASQNGPLNNAGTINVNTPTSWEAQYMQPPGGVLNVNAGLSMQHLDSAAGVVNINAGTLQLLELHSGANSFNGATINGPGTLQIGKGAGGSLTTVGFNNVTTSGGLKVLREQFGGLTFSGANSFANTSFFANDVNDVNIHWVIPAATYTGTTQWWAKGNISFANDVTFGGPVTLGAGWNVNIGTPDVVGPSAGSIQVIDKQVVSTGAMTLKAGGDILLQRSAAGSTRVESSAAMAVEAWGDLKLLNYYNPGGSVELKSIGNQSIQLNGGLSDLIVQASGGGMGGGFTSLNSGGTQTINFTAAGAHTLVLTGGMVGTTSASGAMASVESTGAQAILNGGSLAINLTGGNVLLNTQDNYEDFGLPSQRTVCTSCATHNSAQIRSKSSQNIAATTITIIGGSAGNGNHANIDASGASSIVASGAVSITGGATGGLYVGGTYDDYVSNDAGIGADGALLLTASSITLNGGSADYGGAYVGGGSSVTVNTVGNLTLNGGTTAAQGAALTYADPSPSTLKWLAPAVIGSDAGSLTTIAINIGGSLTLNGGLMGQDGGSAAMIGGVRGTPVNLTILSQGGVNLSSTTALADRIGSHDGGSVQISSGLGGTGSMSLGKGLIGTGQGTGGSVTLYSTGTGPFIGQDALGMILTDALNATATTFGPISLLSFENRVGNFDATTGTGLVTFNAQSVGLGTINSGTGGASISALYDIHDNNGSAINISGPSVVLQSLSGGSAGSLAISADVAATSSIVAQVNAGSASGGIRVANTSPAQPSAVTLTDNASAGTSASFSQNFTGTGTLTATGAYFLTALNGGSISLASDDGLDYSSATFNTGGNGSVVLSADGLLGISGALAVGGTNDLGLFGDTLTVAAPVSGKNITLSGSTVNIAASTAAVADVLVGGDAVNINNLVTAQNVIIGAGNLTVGNTGGVLASNSLVAVVTGDANINGGYLKTSAGDLEMIVGGDLNIGNASYGGYLWAGYNRATPYFPDASIAVGGDLKLNNGAYINAANDVYIDLLGPTSTLVINDGTAAYAPSYILSDIGTGIAATTHVAFLSRNSGGIVIDGQETTRTVVGGSGFFAVNTSTPATAGAGLDISYAGSGTNDLCAISPDLCKPPAPGDTPIEDAPSSFETAGPGGTKPVGDLSKVVGGTEGTFGGEEGGDEKNGDKKDDKDKKSDQAKEEKKDEKPAAKKVAQCA